MVTFKVRMLNSSDPLKYHEKQNTFDYEKNHSQSLGWLEFYSKNELHQDGFIFPDGSLRFQFFVKKNNYQQRLEAAEGKNKALEK